MTQNDSALVLSNRYKLIERIGSGGMAEVFRAWDPVKQREVAVKILRSEYNENDEFVRRFTLEANAASRMSHPNIVAMYDVGLDGDKRYIVMEYVQGSTLKEMIRKAGRFQSARAVQIALQILGAVNHAHESHIVHRDIKPQNILVDRAGNIMVADFGIARATNVNTQTSEDGESVMGSVHYFSPEQASGQSVDERSDLYSVGVVLYEMLTGRVPFDGETSVAVALKQIQKPPVSLQEYNRNIGRALNEVVLKSLEKDAERRYQTAFDFAEDLKRALRNPKRKIVSAPPVDRRSRQERREERRALRKQGIRTARNLFVVTAVVTVVVLLFVKGEDWYREMFARVYAPTVLMLDVEEAIQQLDDLGLRHTLEEKHYDDIGYNTVVTQEPAAGKPMWPGETVKLGVSIGKEKLMMPKLLEITRSEAVKVIEQNDLLLAESDVTLVISDAPVGTVVAQEPPVNEWVKPGDSVRLFISGESAVMPMLLGLPLEEAKGKLTSSGFLVDENILEKWSAEAEGTVIGQSVDAGLLALLGMPIQLTVSQASADSYRATRTLVIAIPAGGADVRCTVEEGGEESERFSGRYEQEGNQSITLDLETSTPGEHTLRAYVNGELKVEESIEFG